ncbi:MAG: exodeoxyribonuclease VII large subunit [Gammaproteobacteria bacterium]|nr:exodeoxyribonuclease VII large subunit [Gammaproteobacteria bacterium]
MPTEAAITVSQLNRKARTLLEQGIARLWVEGEISNMSRPASGHIYFSLKDEAAQVSAAWFRQRQRGPAIGFKNGDRVLAYGRVSLYEARGNFQFIVEQMEPAGEGVLKQRYEALKKKLLAEGLFEEDRKQALPALPGRIGVITSPSGAAIRDIVSVLARRFPSVPVIIYPAAVQGDAAPGELAVALQTAIRRNECEVLIIGRGGGSLEDLWAFNDETLARAIADCPIPIVSAVGHEVDFTICDFVADVRAPTPSGAAEIVVPDRSDWLHRVSALALRIGRIGQRSVEDRAQALDWLGKRLLAASPEATLRRQHSSLRENRARLVAAMNRQLLERRNDAQALRGELMQLSPALAVQRSIARLASLRQQLATGAHDALSDVRHRLALLGRALHSVSPLATLDRGYAIVKNAQGKVVTNAATVQSGDEIRASLSKGELVASVTKVIDK